MTEVFIVNCGVGNVGSVSNMLDHVGVDTCHWDHPSELSKDAVVVLPGVGSFDYAVKRLEDTGFRNAILQHSENGGAVLGICLGMQLLGDASDEGELSGLGLIPGRSIKFQGEGLSVPHLGWNYVAADECDIGYQGIIAKKAKFYFVHSYFFECKAKENVVGRTRYGGRSFASVIARDRVYGVQFHPEKSHAYGLNFFRAFFEKIK